jgi:hypothetical protein
MSVSITEINTKGKKERQFYKPICHSFGCATIVESERNRPMTAVQTLRDAKEERLTDNFAPQERIESEKPKTPLFTSSQHPQNGLDNFGIE